MQRICSLIEFRGKGVWPRTTPVSFFHGLWCPQIARSFVADVFGDQPLFANTDMVQRWHLLGFVVQRPSSGPEPIFVETQRGDLHKPALLFRPRPPALHGGLKLPRPDSDNQPIETVESLRTHLQTAMAVELSTIPLYLFGMYSVKTPAQYVNDPRYYDPITGAVRSMVVFSTYLKQLIQLFFSAPQTL